MTKTSNLSTQRSLSITNHILKALPKEDFERLLPDLEPIDLTLSQVLYRPEEPIKYVYFPNNSIICIIANTAEGKCTEVGIIGREGMTGMDALMGADSTLNSNIVQHPAAALRVHITAIRREFNRCGALHHSLLCFTRLLMIQIGQTALCNRLHPVEERLARLLLICRDRSGTNELQLTHEFLAFMLGVNRPSVTLSAIALQSDGFIKYSRGHITVTDGEGLEDFTCACYQTVKQEYDRFQK